MKKIVKVVALLLAFVLIYAVVDRVMSVKSDDGINVIRKYYALPPDTVDVLFLGSSHIGVNVNPSLLMEEYGISSFSLWSSMQTLWNSYYYLQEGLKSQKPKVVVVEMSNCAVDYAYSTIPVVLKGLNGMRPGLNKLRLALCSFPTWQEGMELLWGMPVYHTRYNELSEEDVLSFGPQDTSIQQADDSLISSYPLSVLDYEAITERLPLGQKQETYLRKIIALCKAKEIPLVLLISPYEAVETEAMRLNEVERIAAEEGVICWNYLKSYKEIGIDPAVDYVDAAHFNTKGNLKYTYALGERLSGTFELPDRRQDKAHIWSIPTERKEETALYRLEETFLGDGRERYVDTGMRLYENPRSHWTLLTRLDMSSFEVGETCLSCYSNDENYAGLQLKKDAEGLFMLKLGANSERRLAYTGETADVAIIKQNEAYTVYINGQMMMNKEEISSGAYGGTLLIGCQEQLSGMGRFNFSHGRVLNLEIYEKPQTAQAIAAWSPQALPEPQLPLGLFVATPETVYTLPEQFMGGGEDYDQEAYLDTKLRLLDETGTRFTLLASVTPHEMKGDGVFFSCFSEQADHYRGLLVRQLDDQTLNVIVGANYGVNIPITLGQAVRLAIVKDGSIYTVYADGQKVLDQVESHADVYDGTLLVGAQHDAEGNIFRVSQTRVNSLTVLSGVMEETAIRAHAFEDAAMPVQMVASSVDYRLEQPFAGNEKTHYVDTGVMLYDAPAKDWTLQTIVRTRQGTNAGVYLSCFSEDGNYRGFLLRQNDADTITLHMGQLVTHTIPLTEQNRVLNLVVVKRGDTYRVYANGEFCEELESSCTRYKGTLLVGCEADENGEAFRFSNARVDSLELWDGAVSDEEALRLSGQKAPGSRFD